MQDNNANGFIVAGRTDFMMYRKLFHGKISRMPVAYDVKT